MTKISKTFILSLLSVFIFVSTTAICHAQAQELKKGLAHGTFALQGYSFVDDPGTLRFYAVGAQAEESSLSYVDDAYISLDEGDYQGNPYELKGKFSGGPNGIVTFTTPGEGFTFSVPLKDGRTFDLDIPGVQVHMTVTDPSIFESEEDVTEEYDPNVPLEDSRIKINHRNGQLEIACPPDLEAWDILKEGRVIYTHCHIKTGEDSTVELDFPDMTTFKMRPETEITIAAISKQSKIDLLAGNIWANVKKMVKNGTMEVHSGQAVAGIKGTTFVMEETSGTTTLKVIEGEVEFKDKADGKTETVTAGQALAVDLRGFGEKIAFDIQAEEKNWNTAALTSEIKEISDTTKSQSNYAWWFVGIGAIIVVTVWMIVRKKMDKRNKI